MHNYILLYLGEGKKKNTPKEEAKTNWIQFKRIMGGNLENIPRIEAPEDMDHAFENLERVIQQAVITSMTTVKKSKLNKFEDSSQELKDLITNKRRARIRTN